MGILGFIQNIGPFEWLVIALVALLLFGSRLPGVARALGRSVSEFKKGVKEGEDELKKTADAPSPDGKKNDATPAG
ncbi:MAG: twin-arginine translocase TatA/TatE family subunit [Planctomycetota bacterium]